MCGVRSLEYGVSAHQQISALASTCVSGPAYAACSIPGCTPGTGDWNTKTLQALMPVALEPNDQEVTTNAELAIISLLWSHQQGLRHKHSGATGLAWFYTLSGYKRPELPRAWRGRGGRVVDLEPCLRSKAAGWKIGKQAPQ